MFSNDIVSFSSFLGEHVVEAKFSEYSEPEEEELVPHLEEEPMLTRLEVNANLELAQPETNSKLGDEYSTAFEGDNVRAYEEEGGEGHMVSDSSSLCARSLDIPTWFGELQYLFEIHAFRKSLLASLVFLFKVCSVEMD